MELPRTIVGYCASDFGAYQAMRRWREQTGIAFDFSDCALHLEARQDNEAHIKAVCRERMRMAGAYIMLIGPDTLSRSRYVPWEAQVAREKGCRMIGVNLDDRRQVNPKLTPVVMVNSGALFVPFSPWAVEAALQVDVRRDRQNYELTDEWYAENGYEVTPETAVRGGAEPAVAP